MTTSSGATYFHYNGDKVIYETDANNNIVTDYTWDDQGNPVTMTKDGTTYYYHVNGHGDVTALTDTSGNIVAQYQYDALGNIVSSTGSMKDANPYRYAGYRYDDEIGLYYLMARYYDANVGRFITRDTFFGFKKDSLSLNQYAYTKNNPVMYFDPSGHAGITALKSYWWGYKLYLSTKAISKVDWLSGGVAGAYKFLQWGAELAGKSPTPLLKAIVAGIALAATPIIASIAYANKKKRGVYLKFNKTPFPPTPVLWTGTFSQ